MIPIAHLQNGGLESGPPTYNTSRLIPPILSIMSSNHISGQKSKVWKLQQKEDKENTLDFILPV